MDGGPHPLPAGEIPSGGELPVNLMKGIEPGAGTVPSVVVVVAGRPEVDVTAAVLLVVVWDGLVVVA